MVLESHSGCYKPQLCNLTVEEKSFSLFNVPSLHTLPKERTLNVEVGQQERQQGAARSIVACHEANAEGPDKTNGRSSAAAAAALSKENAYGSFLSVLAPKICRAEPSCAVPPSAPLPLAEGPGQREVLCVV